MELRLVEASPEKSGAQRKLAQLIAASWKATNRRTITWRPDKQSLDVVHDSRFWFAAIENKEKGRFWNSVGAYKQSGALQIAVELNVSIKSNERTVSGFFAKDEATGDIYLMHDGAVGGGHKGVNRAAFLYWSKERLIPVVDSQGRVRLGVMVSALRPGVVARKLADFAQKVLRFKQAVREGAVSVQAERRFKDSVDTYTKEFSGKKKRQRVREMEYISRHGDIVDALRTWRSSRAAPGERILNTMLLDLGVKVSGVLTEVYEVKTSTDRQALYTAIGQILVHDNGVRDGRAERYLVLPREGCLPNDVSRTLEREQITVLRFEMTKKAVRIFE